MKPLVIYHSPCADGFTAAWLTNMAMHFRAGNGVRPTDWVIDRHPAKYGEDYPDVAGREVYIVDFSYPPLVLEQMALEAKKITVIDHHATPIKLLEKFSMPNVELVLSTERSGAYLVAQYFWPKQNPPDMVKLVDDRDRWQFRDPRTKPFHASLFSRPYAIGEWNKLCDNLDAAVFEGAAIEGHIKKQTEELVAATCHLRMIDGQEVPCANLPYTYASDGCHLMLEQYPDAPFAASWFLRSDGLTVFSLRSRTGSDVDVSEICLKYGGGGHKHAAGMTVDSFNSVM